MLLWAEIMSGALGKQGLKQMLVRCFLEFAAERCASCGAGEGPGRHQGGKVKGWNRQQAAVQGRMGCFEDTRQGQGRSCPLPERRRLRLNSKRLEFPNGRAGSWHRAVTLTEQQPPRWPPCMSSKTKGDVGGFPPLPGSRSWPGHLTAAVCRMTPRATLWNPGARRLLWSRRARSGTHSPPENTHPMASAAQPCTMAQGMAPFQVQHLKEMIISRKETPLTSIRELICT